jgi:hypothetical protein
VQDDERFYQFVVAQNASRPKIFINVQANQGFSGSFDVFISSNGDRASSANYAWSGYGSRLYEIKYARVIFLNFFIEF